MRVLQVPVGRMQNFAYLLGGDAGDAILVDPAWDVPALLAAASGAGLRVTDILVTHGHGDHVNGVAQARAATGARVWAHELADHPVDEKVSDGARLRLAGLDVEVVHTPGHRFDSACYVVGGTHVLTGDTLFVGECGRVDLPGSDPRAMHRSLLEVLAGLPRHLVVLPGHDYGKSPTSTLEDEFRTNFTLKPRGLEEFLRFMAEP